MDVAIIYQHARKKINIFIKVNHLFNTIMSDYFFSFLRINTLKSLQKGNITQHSYTHIIVFHLSFPKGN